MARCHICGRGSKTGQSRSHSNIASKRKFKINIQAKRIDGKKQPVCTRCIKTMAKTK